MMKLMYNKNTLYEELLENKEINISFELFYAHLEYLYYNSLISYPNTIAEKLSTFNFFNFISNEKYETLKQKQPNLFDFEMKNNHSPLYILKLDKINIEEAIFTEEHCEFKKEDYNNPVFDEKLLFLNIIYSKIENRTKEILGII